MTTHLIGISMTVEECVLTPPKPGNWWVGYYESSENVHKPEDLCTEIFKKDRIIMSGCWVLAPIYHLGQDKERGCELSTASLLILPVTILASCEGTTMIVQVTGKNIMIIDHTFEVDLINAIEEESQRLSASRRKLVFDNSVIVKP